MTSEAITRVFDDAIRAAIPESSLTISQWADTYRFLSPERSARPGRWRTDFVPYLRVPMDLLTRSDVYEEVLWKSSQVAGTSFVENVIGYYTHIDPSTIQYVCEDEKKAEAWQRESFRPMVRDTPVLSSLIGDPKQRDGSNTLTGVSYPGGHLALGWATSPATLSSRPRRIVIFDEMDAFKPTAEGDPVKLGEARTRTYPHRKVIKNSSPRNRIEPPPGSPPEAVAMSPIERAYHQCKYRGKFLLPCPHCGEFQELEWSRVKWDDGDKLAAYYVCVSGCQIEHAEKSAMLAAGKWRFEGKEGEFFWEDELDGLTLHSVGFFIWEAYSPFTTWGEVAADQPKKHEIDRLKVWINTRLGQPWDEQKEEASVEDLAARRSSYGEFLPKGVLLLTAGVDVQGNRLEIEIVGWGFDDESWSIDYHILEGDPSQEDVWRKLKELLLREYEYEVPIPGAGESNGDDDQGAAHVRSMRVVAACIDTGGHHSGEVHKVCYQHRRAHRWFAIKGASTAGKPLISKPSMWGKPPVKLYSVGTEAAKDTLAAHLLITEPGPGYCHFPDEFERDGRVFYGEAYFKQLRSERAVTRYTRGVASRRWEKIKQGARNEALDTRVYAMAARAILNPDFRALLRRRESAAKNLMPAPVATKAMPTEEVQASAPPRAPRRFARRGQRNFATGWKD